MARATARRAQGRAAARQPHLLRSRLGSFGLAAVLVLAVPCAHGALLTHYYPFDGNFNDAVGSLNGQAVTGVPAVPGGAAYAGTTNGYPGLGGAAVLPGSSRDGVLISGAVIPLSGSNQSFSIAFWEYSEGTTNTGYMLGAGPTDGYEDLFLRRAGDNANAYNGMLDYVVLYSAPAGTNNHPVSRQEWHHNVLNYDATTRTADWFVDGVLRFSRTGIDFQGFYDDLYIGRRKAGDPRDWYGRMDDLRVYSGTLDSGGVSGQAALGQKAGGEVLSFLPLVRPPAPVSGYLLDEGTGSPPSGSTADSFNGNPGGFINTDQTDWITSTPFAYAGNHAFDFDGNDAIVLGQPSNLNFRPGTDTFTIATWFLGTDQGSFLAKGDDTGANRQFQLGVDGTNRLFAIIGGVTTAGSVPTGSEWHHAAVVVTLTDVKLYLDGALDVTGAPGTATDLFDILLGARRAAGNTGLGYPYTSGVDEVGFWNLALSDEEVRWLFYHSLSELLAPELVIPEPASLSLLGLGVLALLRRRRR
ncbi:MAG TPA: LamG-like jellyroll fold domain-containing protein [Planctomycetota bacterium]|nr:LamG-like jellyroll fold domain-containing protein [Planctomycetota bacterium]